MLDPDALPAKEEALLRAARPASDCVRWWETPAGAAGVVAGGREVRPDGLRKRGWGQGCECRWGWGQRNQGV